MDWWKAGYDSRQIDRRALPAATTAIDVAARYLQFVDYRCVHAGQTCLLEADGYERHISESVEGDLWRTHALGPPDRQPKTLLASTGRGH